MKKITLPNFSGTKEITIELNNALEPNQNIQQYFKKAKKGKKGLKKITDRLKSVEEKLDGISNSLEKLAQLTTPDELFEFTRLQKGSSFHRKEKSPEGFRKFVLDKHYTVYVGRNAKGANKSTPPDILKTTASIAAYYSKIRHSKIVPVTYTEKKYVSKPRKSPPGTASIQREIVLFVNPSIPSSDLSNDT
jgi:predicted ribosome quality control (RQC) complex YloA/Tae2 family protein